MKKKIQRIIRFVNISIYKKALPKKISLYFHDIDDITLKSIKQLVDIFHYQGYRFTSVTEFNNLLNNDSEKLVSLSFDDGFSSWRNLLSFFEENDVISTFFINSIIFTHEDKTSYLRRIGSFREKDLLNLDDLNALKESKHEIGAHTHSHEICRSLLNREFEKDLELNLKILKNYDIKPTSFAIPFGMRRYIRNDQIEILKKYFKVICFGEPGMQFKQNLGLIERSPWIVDESYKFNLINICTDTSFFNKIFKRSGLG